jgi:hypothetical protein
MSAAAVTLKGFAQLADYIDIATLPPGPPEEEAASASLDGSVAVADSPDLDALLAELASASALLASVAQSDAQLRTSALQDLERYDALLAQAQDADRVFDRADQVRSEAEAFSASAFGDEARAASERVVRLAASAAATASDLGQRRRHAADQLAARPDIQRLLEERRRAAELEQARAADVARADRRDAMLVRVREAIQLDRLGEARRLMAPLIQHEPEHPDVLAVRHQLAQRTFVLRALAAGDALRAVRRRELRDDPAQAVVLLAALEVDDLPDPLGRQVFGAWATACRQLCEQRELLEPLRYAPDPGSGLVIARERANGPYVVVSALGTGPEWRPGLELRTDTRDAHPRARRHREILRRARPLR